MGTTDAFAVDPVKKVYELVQKYPNPDERAVCGRGGHRLSQDGLVHVQLLDVRDEAAEPLPRHDDAPRLGVPAGAHGVQPGAVHAGGVALGVVRAGGVGDAALLWHVGLPLRAGRHPGDPGVPARAAGGRAVDGVRERDGQRLRDAAARVRAARGRGGAVRARAVAAGGAAGAAAQQRAAAAGGGRAVGVVPLGRAGGRAVRRVHQLHVGLPHHRLQRRHVGRRGGVRAQGVPHERQHHHRHHRQAAGRGARRARPRAGRRARAAAAAAGRPAVRRAQPRHLVRRRRAAAGAQAPRARPRLRRRRLARLLAAAQALDAHAIHLRSTNSVAFVVATLNM
ncbi:glutamate decarboxylase [Gracilaria domingensis]|nr:glutamate decarboxylase [Gracilaria domingensis]